MKSYMHASSSRAQYLYWPPGVLDLTCAWVETVSDGRKIAWHAVRSVYGIFPRSSAEAFIDYHLVAAGPADTDQSLAFLRYSVEVVLS